VAELVSELRFDQIPERSARAASEAILDGVGVALAGSTAEQVVNAIGIATSMASGVTSNFETMSKPLHAGLAARNGVQAAQLAGRGFSAGTLALESGKGFFEADRSTPRCGVTAFDRLMTSGDNLAQ
jgi:2-methylcitrate dehydratase PrpD